MRKMFMTGISLFVVFIIWAQGQQGNEGYVINGKVMGEYHGKVYLGSEDGIGGNFIPIDSCEVIDGKYTFQGKKVHQVTMHYIRSNTGSFTPFFLENGRIRIEGYANDFYNARTGGTINNEIFRYYNSRMRCFRDSVVVMTTINKWRKEKVRQDSDGKNEEYKHKSKMNTERYIAIEKGIILSFSDQPIAPLLLINNLIHRISFDELKQLRDQLSPQLEGHPYMLALDEYIKIQDFKVGSEAYIFQIPGIDGKKIQLEKFRGKYVLLDFWASWCGPCRQEMPNIVKLYKDCKGKNFEIIGISLDKEAKNWKKAVEDMHMVWPQGCDLRGWNSDVVRNYNIRAIPATVLLDPQGKVEGLNLRGKKLEEKVREVLKH